MLSFFGRVSFFAELSFFAGVVDLAAGPACLLNMGATKNAVVRSTRAASSTIHLLLPRLFLLGSVFFANGLRVVASETFAPSGGGGGLLAPAITLLSRIVI